LKRAVSASAGWLFGQTPSLTLYRKGEGKTMVSTV